jgi:hypothetical protein
MDRGRLWKLRIFELSFILVMCLILIAFMTVTLWYYHSSVVVVRMIFILGLLFAIKDATPAYDWSVYKLIPWLRELKDYELGRSKRKLRRQSSKKELVVIGGVCLAIAFALPLEQDPRPMPLFVGDWLSIMCWLLVMVIVHWFVHKLKSDTGEGNKRKEFQLFLFIFGGASVVPILYFRSSFEEMVARFLG